MRDGRKRSGAAGLWDTGNARDACGVGLVVDRRGAQGANLNEGPCGPPNPRYRRVLSLALTALARLSHRGAVDADGRTGDGAGVTTRILLSLFRRISPRAVLQVLAAPARRPRAALARGTGEPAAAHHPANL